MPCLRTPSTSSNPNAFEPTIEISLKYSGVSSHHVGPCTPAFTSVPRALQHPRARPRTSPACRPCRTRRRCRRGTPSAGRRSSLQHAARPRGRFLDHLQRGRVPDHRRAELARHLGLRLEARDDEHFDVGVQRAQDRGRARAERARAVDHHLAARRRRVPRDRVQRHRERVGEHRELVGDVVGHLEQLRVVRGHQLGVAAVARPSTCRCGCRARSVRRRTTQHRLKSPRLARRAHRRDAARPARQPRVEHDAVADLEPFGLGTERDDVGDDFVAEHLRQREERLHRVVGRPHLAPVHEHLLGVRAADAGEPGLGDDPVGQQEPGLVHVDELHRRVREVAQQVVVGVGLGHRIRLHAVEKCFHRRERYVASDRERHVVDDAVAELLVALDRARRRPRARSVAVPPAAREARERAAVHRERDGRRRRGGVEQHRAAFRRNVHRGDDRRRRRRPRTRRCCRAARPPSCRRRTAAPSAGCARATDRRPGRRGIPAGRSPRGCPGRGTSSRTRGSP